MATKTKLPMIHWDTVQEGEDRCRSDNGGSNMKRDDGAVYLHLRSDLVAGPELLSVLNRLEIQVSHAIQLRQVGCEIGPGIWSDLYESCQEARAVIRKAKGKTP